MLWIVYAASSENFLLEIVFQKLNTCGKFRLCLSLTRGAAPVCSCACFADVCSGVDGEFSFV